MGVEIAGTRPIHMCVEKIVPATGEELAVANFWPQHTKLRIYLMDGHPLVRAKVEQYARTWLPYINLTFEFVDDPNAEIRVAFVLDNTSWSAIGTDALSRHWFPKETMNFGWLTPESPESEFARVITHEFGHALGCIHEHQNPAGHIQWNKPAVYAYYQQLGWTADTVDQNIFDKWELDQTQYSSFDRHSIMLYPIQKELTLNGYETQRNYTLSEMDKLFIASLYPRHE